MARIPSEVDVFTAPADDAAEPAPRCCRCKKTTADGARFLAMRRHHRVRYIVCADCAPLEAERLKRLARQKPGIPVSPETLAKRLDNLDRARFTRTQRSSEIRNHVLTDGVPVPNRQYQVLLMHLGGIENSDIARALGYVHTQTICMILKRPHIRAAIEKVEKARLERILSGDFGVQAMARTNAPTAMKRIITEVDGAEKASDRIKAAETNLKIAGELVDKKVTHHVHEIIRGMTQQELVEYVQHRRWPARLQPIVSKLGLPGPS